MAAAVALTIFLAYAVRAAYLDPSVATRASIGLRPLRTGGRPRGPDRRTSVNRRLISWAAL